MQASSDDAQPMKEETHGAGGDAARPEQLLPQNPAHSETAKREVQDKEEGAKRQSDKFRDKKGPVGLKERWNRTTLSNRLNVILTGVICVITFVNVGFFVKQVFDQDKQVESITSAITNGISEAKDAANESIAESKRAIETTLKENRDAVKSIMDANREQAAMSLASTLNQSKQAMGISIEAFRLDQRAWVALRLDCAGCISHKDGSLVVESLNYIVTNAGKTPAINMSTIMGYTVRPRGSPIPRIDISQEFSNRAIRDRVRLLTEGDNEGYLHVNETLAPNEKHVWPIVRPTERITMRGRDCNQWIVYIYGAVQYYDIWQENPRYTTICMMNETAANVSVPESDFSFCPTGNDMN